jgi:hypothetical protein
MGAWTEIVDFTFTANETTRAFTGLNITKDDFIKIVFNHVNPNSSQTFIRLFGNDETTTTDYSRQLLFGSGTTVTAVRSDAARFTNTGGSSISTTFAYLKISENNVLNWFVNRTANDTSDIQTGFQYTTSSGVTFPTGVNTLTFESESTDDIGTDSRIQIYRLDAEKVRDITVTSNSTQVDIPVTGSLDPAITKDSEYLLVADIEKGASGSSVVGLYVNDNTTAGDYYSQRIEGNDSTAAADRFNSPFFTNLFDSTRSMIYAHIKLSEIGAYTAQSYTISGAGTTTLTLRNFFISSTSEAITSITKLNVKSDVTNGIGSDSRFILYKLK